MTTLAALGAIITVVGGVAALVFLAKPGWRPCVGSAHASFAAAPVIPNASYREHLVREGTPYKVALAEPDLTGAEVRFTFESDGYKGKPLAVTTSLLEVGESGDVIRVVRGKDRQLAKRITPSRCSERAGEDTFILLPRGRSRRYRVLLELFDGEPPEQRVDLIETAVFRS